MGNMHDPDLVCHTGSRHERRVGPHHLVEEIDWLLTFGYSQTRIARDLGVNPESVRRALRRRELSEQPRSA